VGEKNWTGNVAVFFLKETFHPGEERTVPDLSNNLERKRNITTFWDIHDVWGLCFM
jgi:hypothetical protein